LNLSRGFFRETGNDWCKDILCPGGVTDDGAFDGCYADVEKAVLVLEGEAFEEAFRSVLVRWAAMRQKDSEYWLKKRGV
jgi:hypothetical protein